MLLVQAHALSGKTPTITPLLFSIKLKLGNQGKIIMLTTRRDKTDQLPIICNKLYKSTQQFLEKQQHKSHYFFQLTSHQSDEEKIACAILDMLDKTTSSMCFPKLPYYQENIFLDSLNNFYKQLVNLEHRTNVDFVTFFLEFQAYLGAIVGLLCPAIVSMKLAYLDYYLACREVGMDDLPLSDATETPPSKKI